MTIIVDTREHEGANTHIIDYFNSKNVPWIKRKLEYGDYSYYVPANPELGIMRDLWFDNEIIIERKANLDEFANNVTTDRSRIKKEFTLAPKNKLLLIENASYSDMINGNYRSNYSAQSYYGTIHSFWHEFNLPVVFIEDPKYSGVFIRGHFQYHLRGLLK